MKECQVGVNEAHLRLPVGVNEAHLRLRDKSPHNVNYVVKGMEHVPNMFMSFEKYLFLEVISILI